MDKEEIIDLARQSGLIAPSAVLQEGRTHDKAIEAFAKLIAEKERDECAKVCDKLASDWYERHYPGDCAKAIRARGQE